MKGRDVPKGESFPTLVGTFLLLKVGTEISYILHAKYVHNCFLEMTCFTLHNLDESCLLFLHG